MFCVIGKPVSAKARCDPLDLHTSPLWPWVCADAAWAHLICKQEFLQQLEPHQIRGIQSNL